MRASAIAHLRTREEGFTLIELLVATVLLAVGILAIVSVFDSSRVMTTVAQKQTVAAAVGEREMEHVAALGYNAIGLTGSPVGSTDPSDPNYYVSVGPPARYQWDPANSANTDDLCLAATDCAGDVAPGPISWTAGGLTGKLDRYVTWVDDSCSNCTDAHDYKRVTIAVTVDGANAPKKPVVASTIVSDPTAGPGAPG